MDNVFLSLNIRSYLYPRTHFLKGLLNEVNGNKLGAKQNYQNLLNLWRDGDKNSFDYQIVLQRFNSL